MSVPSPTAEFSLYRSDQQYRTVGSPFRGYAGVVRPADSCVNECIRDCVKNADGWDTPTSLLERECKPMCVQYCREQHLPQCGPGNKLCRRLNTGQPECCPEDNECCTVFDWTGTVPSRNVCCPPGKTCCHGNGCYVPGEMNCSQYALCTLDQTVCGSECCEVGERCHPQYGCIPADAVICNGVLCPRGNVCTPAGCCLPRLATSSDCCVPPRGKCGDKCCAAGESCYPGNICCTGERWLASPDGGGTCL